MGFRIFLKKKKKENLENTNKRFDSSKLSSSSLINQNTVLEGHNVIYNSDIRSSIIGSCTVIGNNDFLCNCKIGRFCSIGSNISVVCGNHPLTFVSSYCPDCIS